MPRDSFLLISTRFRNDCKIKLEVSESLTSEPLLFVRSLMVMRLNTHVDYLKIQQNKCDFPKMIRRNPCPNTFID